RHPQAAAGRRLAAAGRRRRRHSPAARLAAEFLRRRSAASRSAAGFVMVAGAMRIFMSADTVGGVWNYTLELARGLIEAGDEVVVAAMGGRLSADQRQAVAAIPGLTVHDSALRLEWMASPWTDLERAAGWLLALADTVEPDVVHLNHYAHGALDWPAPSLVVAHSCVYSWHQAVRGCLPESRWNRYREVVRRGLRGADLVAAPTMAMLVDAARYYGPFRSARVIHNGR